MELSKELVEQVIRKVISEQAAQKNGACCGAAAQGTCCVSGEYGIFDDMDAAINAAEAAQKDYMHASLADRKKYVQAIRDVILQKENLKHIAILAVEETGMGDVGCKIVKNRAAAELTPGVEDLTTGALAGDDGLTTIEYSPYGVIGAITPTTNPTETIICNSIGMLAAGNSVVFSPHPRARQVTLDTIKMINEALEKEGAPKNLIVTVSQPSIENTQKMMAHPKVRLLVCTGGPGIVKSVLQSGKKAIGAGPGNPPVVVDETADIEQAAKDIVSGCAFDNNLPCIAEKEIIAVDSIAEYLLFQMKKNGAYQIDDPAMIQKLCELTVTPEGGPKTEFVGKSASYILSRLGIDVGKEIRVITMETPVDHPFVQIEMMMPILPLVRVPDVDTAIAVAIEVEHGNRHSAMMHSKNIDKLTKMAKECQTTIFVKNGPSYAGIGIGGEGHISFTIAGPTGEGITSARSFARTRRCVLVKGLSVR